jgi:hypothetical protein
MFVKDHEMDIDTVTLSLYAVQLFMNNCQVEVRMLGGGGAGNAQALRHVSSESDSLGWTYSFAACGAITQLPAACAGAAPGSAALQQTAGACYGIGAFATRTVAATAAGVALSFSGGDGGRSSVVTVECADVARPQVVRWSQGAPFSYTALVQARAGCALECARDGATGAVCGGAARGVCAMDGSDGISLCVCTSGFAGAACMDIRSSVSHGASAGNNGAYSRITFGAMFLVVIAALWACVLRFVKMEVPLEPRAAQQSISDILEHPPAARSGSLPLVLSVACALTGALFFYSGAPPTNFTLRKHSISPALCNPPAELAPADTPRPLLVVYGDIELYFGTYTVKHFVATVRALKAQYGWREYVPLVNDPRDSAEVMEATSLAMSSATLA